MAAMILVHDNLWRVSVEGQLDYPFETEAEANEFAKKFAALGFDTHIYHSSSLGKGQPND